MGAAAVPERGIRYPTLILGTAEAGWPKNTRRTIMKKAIEPGTVEKFLLRILPLLFLNKYFQTICFPLDPQQKDSNLSIGVAGYPSLASLSITSSQSGKLFVTL
jgi:hypothetical protein